MPIRERGSFFPLALRPVAETSFRFLSATDPRVGLEAVGGRGIRSWGMVSIERGGGEWVLRPKVRILPPVEGIPSRGLEPRKVLVLVE